MKKFLGAAVSLTALSLVGAAPIQAPAAPPHPAAGQSRPVVVELFTSEGCSSCPPADALLRDLARSRADVLPLAFHVTYWNGLGWKDPYSLDGATARQRAYAAALPSEVYTPQLVVDGRYDVIGSDHGAVEAAIRRAAAARESAVSVTLRREGGQAIVEVGSGQGRGAILVVGYDPEHTTAVGRGENTGRTLVEANIVRGVVTAGMWDGAPLKLAAAAPPGIRLAVLVQDASGRIIGAARETGDAS